jgi:hypothetical protein
LLHIASAARSEQFDLASPYPYCAGTTSHFTNQELDNGLVAGFILLSTEHSEKSFASSSSSLILLVA